MTDTDPEILKQIYIDLVEFNDWANRPNKEALALERLTQIPCADTRTEKEKTLSKLGETAQLLFLQCAPRPCEDSVSVADMEIQECIDIRKMDKDYSEAYLDEQKKLQEQLAFIKGA